MIHGLIREHAMGGSCDTKIVWQDGILICPCQALTQFMSERMALQKRDGLTRGKLIFLYADLWSFGSIAARLFRSESYITMLMNQVSYMRYCDVNLFEGEIEPNAGDKGRCHNLTSVPTVCSGHSWEEGLVMHKNWVIVIEEELLASYNPEFLLSLVCKVRSPGLMSPRQRGVPRRGGVWGIRGR